LSESNKAAAPRATGEIAPGVQTPLRGGDRALGASASRRWLSPRAVRPAGLSDRVRQSC
jgi:hypothetical protein